MIPCDLCGASGPVFVLESPGLDGPLVECTRCGLRYVGERRSALTFGLESPELTAERVRETNTRFQNLSIEEEHRLAQLNSVWRLNLIRKYRSSGRLLEVGCARGDFLKVAKESFQVYGVEPNPDLARCAERIAPIHRDVVETLGPADFDVASSFHVIEHVDSPNRFVSAMSSRVKPGGVVVIETPNIRSIPFRLLKSRWRQFIPEHYYFFDPATITRLMDDHGLKVQQILNVGKYASVDLILNRVSRYTSIAHAAGNMARRFGLAHTTFRINPMDIMLVIASKPL